MQLNTSNIGGVRHFDFLLRSSYSQNDLFRQHQKMVFDTLTTTIRQRDAFLDEIIESRNVCVRKVEQKIRHPQTVMYPIPKE
jgi:hypothetical protein